ncbi:MAG: hypothetical protein H6Q13_2210 [Bacteroidetes bacterium]|jgi:hypothetical protein|nr:hypothetical protein [Bacteroidota bacterium]
MSDLYFVFYFIFSTFVRLFTDYNLTIMKTLLFIISAILFVSCEKSEENPVKLDNTQIGIEKITLNGKDYAPNPGSFLISADDLKLTNASVFWESATVEYYWISTEELSSVSVTCSNSTALVEVNSAKSNQLWKIYTITITTTEPEAKVVYTIIDALI